MLLSTAQALPRSMFFHAHQVVVAIGRIWLGERFGVTEGGVVFNAIFAVHAQAPENGVATVDCHGQLAPCIDEQAIRVVVIGTCRNNGLVPKAGRWSDAYPDVYKSGAN